MEIEIAKKEIIHFIGIGGIGMSGLALIMRSKGFKVQGSDLNLNKNIDRLKKEKISVFIGHKKRNINNATIIVISSAIKPNNPEIIQAKKKHLPIYKRGDMLAHIVSLNQNIVVAGSHGKTTTTSLIAGIFSNAKLDPTIINGGVLNSFQGSAKLGKSNWCILESDESDGSFVKLPPTYSVITNIDREHIEHYKSFKNLENKFLTFVDKIPSFGKSFICIDDKNNKNLTKKIKNKNFYTYGVNSKSHFQIKNIKLNKDISIFDLEIKLKGKIKTIIKKIKIPLLGLHNIQNAAAAAAVSFNIGISKDIIKNSLNKFKGVQRRFNWLFKLDDLDFFDDYAHHPTEISNVLSSVKKVYKAEEIISVFQPHRISRLNDLKKEFTYSFKYSDLVILCPIYSAGEKIKLNFNYQNFAKEITKNSKTQVIMISNKFELAKLIKQFTFGKKIIIGMGAGTISSWMRELPKLL